MKKEKKKEILIHFPIEKRRKEKVERKKNSSMKGTRTEVKSHKGM